MKDVRTSHSILYTSPYALSRGFRDVNEPEEETLGLIGWYRTDDIETVDGASHPNNSSYKGVTRMNNKSGTLPSIIAPANPAELKPALYADKAALALSGENDNYLKMEGDYIVGNPFSAILVFWHNWGDPYFMIGSLKLDVSFRSQALSYIKVGGTENSYSTEFVEGELSCYVITCDGAVANAWYNGTQIMTDQALSSNGKIDRATFGGAGWSTSATCHLGELLFYNYAISADKAVAEYNRILEYWTSSEVTISGALTSRWRIDKEVQTAQSSTGKTVVQGVSNKVSGGSSLTTAGSKSPYLKTNVDLANRGQFIDTRESSRALTTSSPSNLSGNYTIMIVGSLWQDDDTLFETPELILNTGYKGGLKLTELTTGNYNFLDMFLATEDVRVFTVRISGGDADVFVDNTLRASGNLLDTDITISQFYFGSDPNNDRTGSHIYEIEIFEEYLSNDNIDTEVNRMIAYWKGGV